MSTRSVGRGDPRAYPWLFASLLLGAAAPPFYRIAANLPPVALAFWVSLAGTGISGVLLAMRPGPEPFRLYVRDRGQLTLLLAWGFGSFALLVLALSAGTHSLSASLVALIYRTWPLMLGLLAWPLLGERLRGREWVGLAIGFAGVVAAYAWAGALLFPAVALPLVAFLFLGAFADAVAAAYSRKYRPANMLSFVFLCNAIALTCFAVLGGAAAVRAAGHLTGPDLWAIVFLGGPQNVGLTILFVRSYEWAEATAPVALVYLASPFVTFAIDLVFLREPIPPAYWLVAIGVLIGALVMGVGRSRPVAPPPAPSGGPSG